MLSWLRGGKEKADVGPGVPELLNVTIGRSVEIDELAYKLWPEDCLVDISSPVLSVVAQGHCDLGEGSHLHRFYPEEDHLLLQMQGGDGHENTNIDEIMLWSYHDVTYPGSDAAWKADFDAIRQPAFMLRDGEQSFAFERAWFDHSAEAQDPMTYWETVHDDRSGNEGRRIYQTAMLYARRLDDGEDEFLLVNMEEPENGERCVTYMVGRPITRHQLRV